VSVRTGVVTRTPPTTRAEWDDRVRTVDGLGHDVLLIPDHLGQWPPLSPLVAAASVSDRLRFGVQVLNNEFWNPTLLAREAAAADVLTDGRLELGFGAGHTADEFAAAGIAYERPSVRVARLAEAVPLVRRLLAGETLDHEGDHYRLVAATTGLATAQHPVPVMIGGNGDRLLALAARQADTVSLVGFTAGTGRTHTDLSHFTWAGLADRIAHVRAEAGDRFDAVELSILVQHVEVTPDRRSAAERWAGGEIDAGILLDSPFVLLGTPGDLADQVARLAEAGVTYLTTFEPCAEALAAARGG
jgi:probable F420-dependent oxidoreductase